MGKSMMTGGFRPKQKSTASLVSKMTKRQMRRWTEYWQVTIIGQPTEKYQTKLRELMLTTHPVP